MDFLPEADWTFVAGLAVYIFSYLKTPLGVLFAVGIAFVLMSVVISLAKNLAGGADGGSVEWGEWHRHATQRVTGDPPDEGSEHNFY